MTYYKRTWWQEWTDANTYMKPLASMRATPQHYNRLEEQVLINRHDIMRQKDAWDIQEFITRMYVKQLLQHPAFQLLVAFLLVVNAITIGLRTNSFLSQKHYELFSIIDDIVLTILICEVILNLLNGFWIYWKDGWHILNFIVVFILLLGFFINELNSICITYTLRVLRLLPVCMAVKPLARIILVILQSVPDMANIIALILFFMLVFAVFGVTLFGPFLPQHFQNLRIALHTLFICLTQDGWVDIYDSFQMNTREYIMEIGGAIYFAIFIIIGGFIGINLLIVVVITNLEHMMKEGEHEQQQQIIFTEGGNIEEDENEELQLVHCDFVRSEQSNNPQTPLKKSALPNLSEDQCDNFCLVLEAIQENLRQYKEIRNKLNNIVEEVRSIRFNQEQEEEMLRRHLPVRLSMESGSLYDMTQQQDLITALVNIEKVQESATNMLLKNKFNP
ncbi:cation channel sperm-associated protein 4 [Suncus etruscus]|uniref:cation channel sperm-associated protein 4 n=1 Tax=Suncus etruscus TaxID=109475 RepID=UPI00210F756D|nr:cation channel sperm-associated protein 4 [Suncus etruscus]